MNKVLGPYKGYVAQMDIDVDANLLYGRVIDLKDMITFQGSTVKEAIQSFHDSVDAYLAFCLEHGESPEKPFSGQIPFRTKPEHHRKILIAARLMQKSINAWMDDVLTSAAEKVIQEAHSEKPVQERARTRQQRELAPI